MTLDSLDTPVLVNMADVEAVPVRWLWPGRLPRGRLSLLAGMPGLGKSFATADFAARVSTGTAWPDGSACDRGSVLFVAAEDDPADTVRPRLDAHNADVSRVHMLTGVHRLDRNGKPVEAAFMLEDLAPLERALDTIDDVRLIVVDPIGSYLGAGVNAHMDTEVRAVLAPLAALASKADAAVLIVSHIRKGTATHPDDLVLGSRAFTGLARSVLHLTTNPDDKQERLLLPGKNNLAKSPDGWGFKIRDEPACVAWADRPTTWTMDEVLAAANGGRAREDDNEHADWLRDVLSNGPIPSVDVKERAEADGFKWRKIQDTKNLIGAKATREGFSSSGRWVWHMPNARDDSP